MRFTPAFLDEIRARLPVSQVVARKVQLKRAGREWKGLSPFKDEKTPSFTVNDQKGFYHCFASGEHGDIFRFVMETEGLSFPEAVERLAGEAGVQMPAREERTPEMERRLDERGRLYNLLQAASEFFSEQLRGSAGKEARDYLRHRGLRRATIAEFNIGYAPGSRNQLKSILAAQGYSDQELALSGMLIHGDDIAVPYDRFRDRVMFPILDLKGRVIAFGGRALDANVPAKYLNSPETPLFHKGAILYNAAKARQPAYERGSIIVVEGYMDVVALSEAGFHNAVAPLGTALTEDQVRLLWRMSAEPLLCFDGDGAGVKAAFRAVETTLPLLKAGHSLSFAFLPDGLDPDDLIRQEGPDALSAVLARAQPLADVLWRREWADGEWRTPEKRAALEQQLFQLLEKISDQTVRGHYQRLMRDKFFNAWRHGGSAGKSHSGTLRRGPQIGRGLGGVQARAGAYGGGRTNRPFSTTSGARWGYRQFPMGGALAGGAAAPATASSALRQSRLVAGGSQEPSSREALLIYALLNHPWLIDDHCEQIAALDISSGALKQLLDGILSIHASNNPLDRSALRTHLIKLGLDKVMSRALRAITHRSDKFAEPQAERAEVEHGWLHAAALHVQQSGLAKALDAAKRAWDEEGSEDALAQIFEIKRRILHGCSDGRVEGSASDPGLEPVYADDSREADNGLEPDNHLEPDNRLKQVTEVSS